MILDRRNSINRIVLFDETISTKGLIKSILPDIGKYGESIIIASNGAKELDIRLLKEYLNTVGAELVDVIEVKQDEDIVNNSSLLGITVYWSQSRSIGKPR